MKFLFFLQLFTASFISLRVFVAAAMPLDYVKDLENFEQKSILLDVEKAKLKAAEDFHLTKKLFWTPSLEVSQGKTKTELKGADNVELDYWRANASLNLFRGGADWALLNQAQSFEKSQILSLKNEELHTDLIASDLIFKNIYLKENLRIQDELYKLKQEAVKIVNERYNSGKTPLQEVTKSEVDLGQQKNKLRLATLSLSENEMTVKSSFVDSIISQNWPFNDKVSLNFLTNASGNIDKTPQVEQKYWNFKASEYLWKSAQRSYWPSIDIAIQYEESPIKERTTQQWTSVLTLKIPLWSKFETAATISSAYASFIKSESEYRLTQQTTILKEEFLLKKVEIVRLNLLDAKKNLQKSKDLYSDLLKSFRLGRLSTNDLLLEQGRLLESQSNLVDAQLSFHQTVVETCTLHGLRMYGCLRE